jgi:hypothetical protein
VDPVLVPDLADPVLEALVLLGGVESVRDFSGGDG